jgi:hypothetical protein
VAGGQPSDGGAPTAVLTWVLCGSKGAAVGDDAGGRSVGRKSKMPFPELEEKTGLPSFTDGLIYWVLRRLISEYRVP